MKAQLSPMKRNPSFRADDQVTKSMSRKESRKLAKLTKQQNIYNKNEARYSAFEEAS
tara:strand:- start:623 stop:793 length:171 start_codon:yes stop_codon:yes gene_type:complete